jgi:hypothetical protein
MAEKKTQSKGGSGITWLIVGFLLGVAVTLGGLAFLSHEPGDAPIQAQSAVAAPPVSQPVAPGAALPAAPAAAPQAEAPTAPPAVAPPSASTAMSAPAADSVDPDVADDAASAGMTSRAPPR